MLMHYHVILSGLFGCGVIFLVANDARKFAPARGLAIEFLSSFWHVEGDVGRILEDFVVEGRVGDNGGYRMKTGEATQRFTIFERTFHLYDRSGNRDSIIPSRSATSARNATRLHPDHCFGER